MIAAYLPGTKITSEDFYDLKLMKITRYWGITWNTFRILKNYQKYDLTIPLEWLRVVRFLILYCGIIVKHPLQKSQGLYFINGKVYKNSAKLNIQIMPYF